jgi:hypothetical protein
LGQGQYHRNYKSREPGFHALSLGYRYNTEQVSGAVTHRISIVGGAARFSAKAFACSIEATANFGLSAKGVPTLD